MVQTLMRQLLQELSHQGLHYLQDDLSKFTCIHVVLGNESCDLDSAVSAITYAFYLSKVNQEKTTLILPLLNIYQSQYRIRTEITYFLKKLHVPAERLVFRDHIDFEELAVTSKLKLTLVDHHILTGQLAGYDRFVFTIIDHRPRERPDRAGVTVKLDLVGSCCTLVAEELLNDPDFTVDEVVAELLFGTILVDTVNRLPEAGKITPRDDEVLQRLQPLISAADGNKLFAEIQAAKLDMSGLTNMDILEKDLKMVTGTDMVIAMASVSMEMQELLARSNFKEDLESFCTSRTADVAVIMTITTNPSGQPERHIAVFSTNRIYRDQIADVLDNSSDIDLDLDLEPQFPPFENISVFAQGNIAASRKSVMLSLGAFLNGDRSPDVASKEFVTDSTDPMATEGFTSLSSIVEVESQDDEVFRTSQASREESLTVSQTAKARLEFLGSEEEKFANAFGAKVSSEDLTGANLSKVGQNFPSGQRSSANSSNLFDFTSDSSELIDPFSSVEESSPIVTGSELIHENFKTGNEANNVRPSIQNQESTLLDLGTFPNFENSNTIRATGENVETVSMATNDINPFLVTLSEKPKSMLDDNNSVSSNLIDDFDPFGPVTSHTEQSYVSYDSSVGPDVITQSSDNPFWPNLDTDSDNPFGPNLVTDIDNPFGPNLVTDIDNPFGPNLVTDIDNPFGPNVPVSSQAHFDSLSTNVTNSENSNFGTAELDVLPRNDTFGLSTGVITLTNSNNNPSLPNVSCDNPFGTDGMDDQVPFDNPFRQDVTLDTQTHSKLDTSTSKQAIHAFPDPFGQLENQGSPSSLSPDDDEQARMEYLGIGNEGGPRAKARKSISLIVEFDRESDEENLAELDEADFYDRVPTPDAEKSGHNSPFINPNFTVPFENLRSGRSSDSGSGYPSVATPPNSVTEDKLGALPKDHDLPSFNNAEMVERIRKKKKSLVGGEDSLGSSEIGLVSTPYTPQNSFRDDFQKQNHDLDLLNFDDDNMAARVTEKRNSLGVFSPVDLDTVNANKPFSEVYKDREDLFLANKTGTVDLFPAELVPCVPSNSLVERSGEFMTPESMAKIELYEKLTQLAGSDETEDFSLLDFSQVDSTKINTQTGVQNPLEMKGYICENDVNQSSNSDSVKLLMKLDSAISTSEISLEDTAQVTAMETVAHKMTEEIIHEAVDTFPDMKNLTLAECVTMEVLMGDNSNWTDQGSGDSGIASNESPQQGLPRSPRSPRRLRGNEYQFSVETEYLPNMDPLHGNLNIVTSPLATSNTIETDAYKEVVESESFRKVSGQGRELQADTKDAVEAAMDDSAESQTDIKARIMEENLLASQLSVNQDEDPQLSAEGLAPDLVDIYDLNIEKESESMAEDSPEVSEIEGETAETAKQVPEVGDRIESLTTAAIDKGPVLTSFEVGDTAKGVEIVIDNIKYTEADIADDTHGKYDDRDENIETNSISPDTSSSFASTTDSESELITVRENVLPDTSNRSPDEKKSEEFESITEENVTTNVSALNAKAIGNLSEQIAKDIDHSKPMQDLNQKLDSGNNVLEETASLDLDTKEDTDMDERGEPGTALTLNLIGVSMTESSLTVETISPVDTPNDEHVSGFYEVNPVEKVDEVVSTNLGDNETGYYEINPENSPMCQSVTTNESQSSVVTPIDEHVSGFYEINPENQSTGDTAVSGEIASNDITPVINIADTDDKDMDSSDEDENTGFYDMNAQLQGTVLQNIDMGHAFSPIESPNDEIFNLNYQVNPMVTDNDTDNSDNNESDNADDLFINYVSTDTKHIDPNIRHDEKFIAMAETMVTEAITGALDTVQEMQFKKNEDFIMTEIASAIEDEGESSDSDTSSTTTEGSYRITHSQDDSPVMSPEMDSFMKEHVKESRFANDNLDNIEEGQDVVEDNVQEVIQPMEIVEDKLSFTREIREIGTEHEETEGIETENREVEVSEEKFEESEIKEVQEVAGTTETVADTTETVTDTTETVADTTETVADTTETVADTTETVADTTETVADTTETVADIAQEPEKNTENTTNNAEMKNVESNMVNEQNKPIDIVETKTAEDPETFKESSSSVKTDDNIKTGIEFPAIRRQETVIPGIVVSYEQTDEKEIGTDSDPDIVDKIKDNTESDEKTETRSPKTDRKQTKVRMTQAYETRKEIYYTSAGRMSISIDSVLDPPVAGDQNQTVGEHDIIHEAVELPHVDAILARAESVVEHADDMLARLSDVTLARLHQIYDTHKTTHAHCGLVFPIDDDDDDEDDSDVRPLDNDKTDVRPLDNDKATSSRKTVKSSHGSHGKMKDMEDTQEWHEDPIPGMAAQEEGSSDSESESDSDSEYTKPVRPDSLLQGSRRKKRITASSNIVRQDSTDELVEGVDDLPTPDDLETPDDMEGEELEWEDDTPITPVETKKFAEYREEEMEREQRENTQFRKVEIAGKDYRVDMHVIEPYKKVLSHGGYYGDGLNAIILFSGCFLPDRGRRDYQYVMDNLFLYVISTLELLVAEDYMIVYFHGATPRRQMPSFGWLKRCYQMIDRRLRKNLKALLMVHPTLWLKTVVMMTKPFISSKFSSKLRFVKTLHELGKIVPMEYIYVPDPVTQYDTRLKQHRTSSSSSTPVSPTSPS